MNISIRRALRVKCAAFDGPWRRIVSQVSRSQEILFRMDADMFMIPGLVLLIMLLACLARRFPSSKTNGSNGSNGAADAKSFPDEFQAVYIVSKHPFAEVDGFVATTSSIYHLNVKRYAMSMKQGLEAYLADRPSVKAIFVGTRRTDPHGEKLTHFDPTDSGWPDFMRVHPVIDWHYGTSLIPRIRLFRVPQT